MRNVLLWICMAVVVAGCQSHKSEIQVLAEEVTSYEESSQYVVNGGPGSTEITYRDDEENTYVGASNVVRVPIREVCEEILEPIEKVPEGPEVIVPPEVIEPVEKPKEEEKELTEVTYLSYQNHIFISATSAPEVFYETEVYIERMPPKIELVKSSDEERLCCDKDMTFRIRFTNVGGDDARDIEIFDIIPDKTEYVDGTVGAEPYLADIIVERDEAEVAKKIIWKIEGPIAPGESGEVFYKVICPKKRPHLACFLKFIPERLKEGEEGKVVCSVTNTGEGMAEDVNLIVNLPPNIEYQEKSVPQRVLLSLGAIEPRETVQQTLIVRMLKGGSLEEVAASVSAANWEGCECEIPQTPVLTIEKTGPTERYNPFDVVYEIAVENTSRHKAPATNCILTDALPNNSTFKEASDGGVYDPEKHKVTWELGTLLPGKRMVRSITIVPQKSGTYVDRAEVSCQEGITKIDEAVTKVEGITALHIGQYDTEDPVEVGKSTTYVIEVRNEGFNDATNLVLRSTMLNPRLTKFVEAGAVDASGNPIDFHEVEDEIVFDAITLESGARAVYKVTYLALREGNLLNITNITLKQHDSEIVVQEPTTPYDKPAEE